MKRKLARFLDEMLRKIGDYINRTQVKLPLEEFVYYNLCHIRYKRMKNW